MFDFFSAIRPKLNATAPPEGFRVLQITAYSDHPVRNSAGELIFGQHVLWEHDTSYIASGGTLNSQCIFLRLRLSSRLNVTIQVVNSDLVSKEYVIVGILNGQRFFESEPQLVNSQEEVVVAVNVVKERVTTQPGSLNGEFTWMMVLKGDESSQEDQYGCDQKTHLELYWTSTFLHEIFLGGLSGIHVSFLRHVIPSLKLDATSACLLRLLIIANEAFDPTSETDVMGVPWPEAARIAFYRCSKRYDTLVGGAHFGVTMEGGKFYYNYYGAPNSSNKYGTLCPLVNCYDQAAMFEVTASFRLRQRPSWLLLSPAGYINSTVLVGVPGACNNPFFQLTRTPQFLWNINHPRRTAFGNHVFNGTLKPWNPSYNWYYDRIYDACHGPHQGASSPYNYLISSIDRVTKLYGTRAPPGVPARPRTFGWLTNIKQHKGVTNTVWRLTSSNAMNVSAATKDFLQKCAAAEAKPLSQILWDDAAQWSQSVLGDQCHVAYKEVTLAEGVAELLYHFADAAKVGSDVVVRVRVETHTDQDGYVDHEASASAALDYLTFQLHNHQLYLGANHEDIETLWAPAIEGFEDHAQYAVQLAPDIPRGRVLIASGNYMIDISGGSSSAALAPVVRQLLMHTTIERLPGPHTIPAITDCLIDIPEDVRGADDEVRGIASTFNVKCQVDRMISAASADIEGFGLLLSKYDVQWNEDHKTSTVIFTFVTRLAGTHDVDLHVAEAMTMATSSKRIRVSVIES
ncbi:hypothetical protein CVT26_010740 [Gymnopilus dilepis]|uniref:Uncharacterized protein n=1 Tax=Gymnopilus dilepis TaxID=231916 RepID=A0A409Y0Q8_9AGAR|nr:hypothetical protein CVT26_010740 [Gymnopilus dilepis]